MSIQKIIQSEKYTILALSEFDMPRSKLYEIVMDGLHLEGIGSSPFSTAGSIGLKIHLLTSGLTEPVTSIEVLPIE